MQAKARKIAERRWGDYLEDLIVGEVIDRIVQNCDNLATCSCEMCRNARRSKFTPNKGKTRQELQAERDLADELG